MAGPLRVRGADVAVTEPGLEPRKPSQTTLVHQLPPLSYFPKANSQVTIGNQSLRRPRERLGLGRCTAYQRKPSPPCRGTSQGAWQMDVLPRIRITSSCWASAVGCHSALPCQRSWLKYQGSATHSIAVYFPAPQLAQALVCKPQPVLGLEFPCKTQLITPPCLPHGPPGTPNGITDVKVLRFMQGWGPDRMGCIIRGQVLESGRPGLMLPVIHHISVHSRGN
jgi:hypothetical protein